MIEAEINKHEELGKLSEKEKQEMRSNLKKNIAEMNS